MKTILAQLFFKLFNKLDNPENAKYDVYLALPAKALSILCIVLGIFITVICMMNDETESIMVGFLFVVLGLFTLLYSCNKWIRILSDEEFEFSNFLGKKTVYKFSDIQSVIRKARPNDYGMRQEKIILVLPNRKIHIEEECVISQRLLDKLK